MLDLFRIADAIRDQADDYGDKAKDGTASETAIMFGTASLVLYGLSIALLRAQKDHDDAPPSN